MAQWTSWVTILTFCCKQLSLSKAKENTKLEKAPSSFFTDPEATTAHAKLCQIIEALINNNNNNNYYNNNNVWRNASEEEDLREEVVNEEVSERTISDKRDVWFPRKLREKRASTPCGDQPAFLQSFLSLCF